MSRILGTGLCFISDNVSKEEQMQRTPTAAFTPNGEEEQTMRVIHATKEKKYEEISSLIKLIRNYKKIRDISSMLSSFEDLRCAYQKTTPVITKEETGHTPRFYVKFLMEMNDFINKVWDDYDSCKNMSKNNLKSLTLLRQELHKYNQNFEEDIAKFRGNPSLEDDEEEEKSEEVLDSTIIFKEGDYKASEPDLSKFKMNQTDENEGIGGTSNEDKDQCLNMQEQVLKDMAEKTKNAANQLYAEKRYKGALTGYNKAIELCPNTSNYYGNRAACYMMLGQYHNALCDAKKCVELDPKCVKGYARIVRCFLILGDIVEAETTLVKLLELDPTNKIIESTKKDIEYVQKCLKDANAAYAAKDFRKVVYCMDRCCDVSSSCATFKITKAECLAMLERYQEALQITSDILRTDKRSADALYVRGLCLYLQSDQEDRAFAHFQQVLRLAPDHVKTLEIYKKAKFLRQKKEQGNVAYKLGQYQVAYNLYSDALAVNPKNVIINAKLHFNRATVAAKMGCINESVKECTEALKLDKNYLKALLRRAACYMELTEYEEAVRDYKKAYNMDKSIETEQLLTKAELALKKSKRKDYYEILGIGKNASTDDIKKAYRKGALVHHPDRHVNASEGEKKVREKKFKEIGEAYGILSDPKKRSYYDSHRDIDNGYSEFQDAQSFFT